jgi:hypothetical protein
MPLSNQPDWPSVAQHLVDDFPEVPLVVVVREVRRAKDAVDETGLDEDAVTVGEVIARQQLSILAGRATDAARLDPQRHIRPDSRAS